MDTLVVEFELEAATPTTSIDPREIDNDTLKRIKCLRVSLLITSCTYIVLALDQLLSGQYVPFFITAFVGVMGIVGYKNISMCPLIIFSMILAVMVALQVAECVVYDVTVGEVIFTVVLVVMYMCGIIIALFIMAFVRKLSGEGVERLQMERRSQ
jgi:hypothetical protein